MRERWEAAFWLLLHPKIEGEKTMRETLKAYWVKIEYKIRDYTHTREYMIDASTLKYARNKIIRKMANEIRLNNIKVSTIRIIDSKVIGYY